MNLLAIDPSIAKPAAAYFRVEAPPPRAIRHTRDWITAASAFVCTSVLDTSAGDLTADRCGEVGAWVAELVTRHRIDLVLVEVPADHGGYDERMGRQRSRKDVAAASLAKLNRSIGAVSAAAALRGVAMAELAPVDAIRERSMGIVAAAVSAAADVDRTLARDLKTTLANEPMHGKKCRHRVLRALLGAAGHALPKREDARDAAWLGVQYLATMGWT